jgi:cytochrome c biogenesis protein CcmG/thiol:disulfide interchange protein DsbE
MFQGIYTRLKTFFTKSHLIIFLTVANFSLLAPLAAKATDLDLALYKGKVVYVDFWASWCSPCKQAFPWLMRLQSSYGANDLAVVAVNVDHDRARADAFLKQTGSNLQVVYDPKGEVATKYDIKGMPSAVLIGRDGRVRYSHIGFFANEAPRYEAQVAELVHEK